MADPELMRVEFHGRGRMIPSLDEPQWRKPTNPTFLEDTVEWVGGLPMPGDPTAGSWQTGAYFKPGHGLWLSQYQAFQTENIYLSDADARRLYAELGKRFG